MKDVDGLLHGWTPCRVGEDVWFVVGRLSGDRKGRFRDGTLMSTSMLVDAAGELAEGDVVATFNSRYLLGSRAVEIEVAILLLAARLGGHVVGPDGLPVTKVAFPAAPADGARPRSGAPRSMPVDDFAERLIARRGTIDPDVDLEF